MLRSESYENMLFALIDLKHKHGGTPEQLTKQFLEAFAVFAPDHISGDFNMITSTTTGEIAISFRP